MLLVVYKFINGPVTLEPPDTDVNTDISDDTTPSGDTQNPDISGDDPDPEPEPAPEPESVVRYSKVLKLNDGVVFEDPSADEDVIFTDGTLGDVYFVGEDGIVNDVIWYFYVTSDAGVIVRTYQSSAYIGDYDSSTGVVTYPEMLYGSEIEGFLTGSVWHGEIYCTGIPTDISFQEYLLQVRGCDYEDLNVADKYLYDAVTQEINPEPYKFSICDDSGEAYGEFEFEFGMTWVEFVASDYNPKLTDGSKQFYITEYGEVMVNVDDCTTKQLFCPVCLLEVVDGHFIRSLDYLS